MTIKEAEDFYETDTNQYDFNCREGFTDWFKKTYGEKGSSYLNIASLNKLVNKIVSWYEFKFPDKELDRPVCTDFRFEHIEDISKYMDNQQLSYRLTHRERETMDCNYRTGSGYLGPDRQCYAGIRLSRNGVNIWDISITMDGKISPSTKNRYKIPVDKIEDFYEVLSNSDDFDLNDMKECIDLHRNDLMLRNYIIDAVRNGLLYSANTIPEYGKIRMDNFTADMFELYPNIVLDAKCNKDITTIKNNNLITKEKGFVKRLLRRGKNEESCNIRKY